MRFRIVFISGLILILSSCTQNRKTKADAIYTNGKFITMDDSIKNASVMVVLKGKILDIGDSSLIDKYTCEPENIVDMGSQYVYPGLIDAHCHFYGYASNLLQCDLIGSDSWSEVLRRVETFAASNKNDWIIGRGWNQNIWNDKSYPNNELLNEKYPNIPLVLKRIDGHAVICNSKALEIAGINESSEIEGGELIKQNGKLTGVLIDNAVDLLEPFIPKPSRSDIIPALQKAEKDCYARGLTCLADAGLDLNTCLLLDSLEQSSALGIYLYLMLNPDENALQYAEKNGVTENGHVMIGSFKLYADGALGSRGARLKKEYCDRHGHSGLMLHSPEYFEKICIRIYNNTDYQVNTHCIGDSANRMVLDIFGGILTGRNDRRWRIEHAQIVDPADISLFGLYSVIPSVQPTHASSDAAWVESRICKDRMAGAYAYKSLLAQNGYLPLGTDFPVEYIDPLYTFYSAVYRKNANEPAQAAFQLNESLDPMSALKGMSIWAARSCRLEHRKGSLSKGKDADFVVMNTDLLNAGEAQVLETQILATYRAGNKVFQLN